MDSKYTCPECGVLKWFSDVEIDESAFMYANGVVGGGCAARHFVQCYLWSKKHRSKEKAHLP